MGSGGWIKEDEKMVAGMQVCRGKYSDRISGFCFDSSHCSL